MREIMALVGTTREGSMASSSFMFTISDVTNADLTELIVHEGRDCDALINRAVQVYADLARRRRCGVQVLLASKVDNKDEWIIHSLRYE
jgi:hypothetical protein